MLGTPCWRMAFPLFPYTRRSFLLFFLPIPMALVISTSFIQEIQVLHLLLPGSNFYLFFIDKQMASASLPPLAGEEGRVSYNVARKAKGGDI
ncbi:hypothetical protein LINGRAHAP2_LOCUS31319 [Linum grandiflorum]